jgi:excisionase family DNA binding protein
MMNADMNVAELPPRVNTSVMLHDSLLWGGTSMARRIITLEPGDGCSVRRVAPAFDPGPKSDTSGNPSFQQSDGPKHAKRAVPIGGVRKEAVSRKEAAEMLGVSEKTIIRLCDRDELQQFRVIGQWRIRLSEIEGYIRRQEE